MKTRRSAADARVTLVELEPAPVTPKKRASSEAKSPSPRKMIKLEPDVPHPAPARWEEALRVLSAQRATIVAPVDTAGCTEAGKVEDGTQRPDDDDRVGSS
jgi:endonuclease-3